MMKFQGANDSVYYSPHFKRAEFACQCGCGLNHVDPKLIEGLERLRVAAGRPLAITSGCRCAKRNKMVGGSPKSQHLCGKAADVRCPPGMTSAEFAKLADGLGCFDGIGTYTNKDIIHVDVRGYRARWTW